MDDIISSHRLRQILFLLLISGAGALLFWNLRAFVPAALGAYTLYILLRQPFHHLVSRRRWPKWLAAAALMLVSAAAIIIPVNWVLQTLGGRLASVLQDPQALWKNAETIVLGIETRYGLRLLTPDSLKSATEWAVGQVGSLVGATLVGLLMGVVAFLILWFMLTRSREMEGSFAKMLPMRAHDAGSVRHQLNNLVYANAVGIPLMGLVQGTAGLLAYWLAGVPEPWLWFALTFIAGMMPIFGAMLAYVPLALMLLAGGQPLGALFVFLYGVVVIGSVDNLARMWLLKKIGHTHPLVTFFGVVAGLKLFGFIGFVFGPILVSMFLLLARIYGKEFGGRRNENHLQN